MLRDVGNTLPDEGIGLIKQFQSAVLELTSILKLKKV
jgi:hypothetical protein